MTRVAKARRKIGIARGEETLIDTWDLAGEAAASEPWKLGAPPEAPATMEEPVARDEEGAMRLKSTVRPEVQEHLVGMVRRVFLPPPLGAGARTVLFAAADGGRDESASCVQAAELLSRHTARTVCLVDTHGGLLTDGRESRPADGPGSAEPLFRIARPLTRNLWRAADGTPPADTLDESKRWFADLAARFDYVLVDGAALRGPGEASLLAAIVEGVILVVDEHLTRRAAARTVAEQLHAAGARLLGVVLTNRSYPIPGGIYRRV